MSAAPDLLWFARHEMRLAWRDYAALLQGRRKRLSKWPFVAALIVWMALHLVAFAVLAPFAAVFAHFDKSSLVVFAGSAFFAWALMLSQAMESATRSFYARADLDLILSSPAPVHRLFFIRIAAVAVTTIAMSAWLIGAFIDAAAFLGGPRLLSAYGLLVAMGASATAVAIAVTSLMFRFVGPRKTRLLAQILAAVVGAGFVIGAQAAAIMSTGSLSRIQMFESAAWVAASPDLRSPFWWPALAATGNAPALAVVLTCSLALLALAAYSAAHAFARNAFAVAAMPSERKIELGRPSDFRRLSTRRVLRRKEWTLLARDPWLLSQTLMQLLYLLPPALLLWRNFGSSAGLVVLAPIVVMGSGQLAGGLAWIALSGEDAPDLVGTAPVSSRDVLRAKIEAVLIAVAFPILPFVVGAAWGSRLTAVAMIVGAACAASSACSIQFFFRGQVKRSHFRRRQTSSKIATFAEAFTSISLAGAAALAAAGTWFALAPLATAAMVLAGARAAAPRS